MISAREMRRRRLGWHGVGVLLIALVIDLSLTPHPVDIGVPQGDKYEHVLAYATLMFWYAQLYASSRVRIGIATAFVAMAIGLEFLQRITGYRTFEITDMAAGALGVLAGWLVAPPRSPRLIEYPALRWPVRR